MELPDALISRLSAARHLVVLTGAGVSQESGIATFRDALTGLWQRYDARELATPAAFERAPELVWGWYEWRRAKVMRAEPNAAHHAIRRLEALLPRLTLVTQNVDDLHERAGSTGVLHLHGSLMAPYCVACKRPFALHRTPLELPEEGTRIRPPRCDACGANVRPGVVWFGEPLPSAAWAAAARAASACDAFLSVGTSAVVYPAASLVHIARRAGAMTMQINPARTGLEGQIAHALQGTAGDVMPLLTQRLAAE